MRAKQTGSGIALLFCGITMLALSGVLFAVAAAESYAQGGPLPAPFPLAPTNGKVITRVEALGGVMFSWTAVEGAQSYVLQLNILGTLQQYPSTGTYQFISLNYASGTSVEWTVWALDSSGIEGAHSAVRSFLIGSTVTPTPTPVGTPTPSAVPELLEPQEGATFTTDQLREGIQLNWTAISGASGYRINLTLDSVPVPPRYAERPPFQLVLDLNQAGTIRWAVQILGSYGEPGVSSGSRLILVVKGAATPTPTPVLPDAPQLLSPEDRAWIRSSEWVNGVGFRWTEVTGAIRYALQVQSKARVEYCQETTQSSAQVVLDLLAERDLFWSVASVNVAGATGSYAPARKIRVRLGAPGDLNITGTMEAIDAYLFSSTWADDGSTSLFHRADLDGDGTVTRTDLLDLMGILSP
ncbi:MAG TPA: hypothetical protein PLZ55_09840 [bacterium]|nr:hypothetical protein [bacterium]